MTGKKIRDREIGLRTYKKAEGKGRVYAWVTVYVVVKKGWFDGRGVLE